VYHPD
jgi:hypothetical protein